MAGFFMLAGFVSLNFCLLLLNMTHLDPLSLLTTHPGVPQPGVAARFRIITHARQFVKTFSAKIF
jgi:hypothetical protein